MSYLVLDIESIVDSSVYTPPPVEAGKDLPFPPFWAWIPITIGCVWMDDHLHTERIGALSLKDWDGLGLARAERNMLGEWSAWCQKHKPNLVSWYGRGFDLPVLQARCFAHGVPMAWYGGYSTARGSYRYRYDDAGHNDLCDQFSEYGATRGGKLDAFAKLIGLPGKHGVDGSEVAGMWERGEYEAIVNYCISDTVQTAFVLLRYCLIRGRLNSVSYENACRRLYDLTLEDARTKSLAEKTDLDRLLLK